MVIRKVYLRSWLKWFFNLIERDQILKKMLCAQIKIAMLVNFTCVNERSLSALLLSSVAVYRLLGDYSRVVKRVSLPAIDLRAAICITKYRRKMAYFFFNFTLSTLFILSILCKQTREMSSVGLV